MSLIQTNRDVGRFFRKIIELARVPPAPSVKGRDVEGVLALFRLFLIAAIVAALYLEQPEFRDNKRVFALAGFLAFAIPALWQATLIRNTRAAMLLHAIDMAFAVILLVLSPENVMLFILAYTYCLLSAAVKASWQWVATTGGVLGFVYLFSEAIDWTAHDRTLIRTSYMALTTVLLARATYGAERGRERMLRLARSVHARHDPNENGRTLTMREACEVLEGDGAVLYWKKGDLWREDVYRWRDGRLTGRACVAPEALRDRGPLIWLGDGGQALAYSGLASNPLPLPETVQALRARDAAIAYHGFQSSLTEGGIYVTGIRQWRWDHLVLAELLSRHVLAQIEAQLTSERQFAEAAELARARLSRDVHDGLLQSLTAVRLQLHAMTHQDAVGKLKDGARMAAEILRSEQERLRDLIEGSREIENEQIVPVKSLVQVLESSAAHWRLATEISSAGPDAMVPDSYFRELSFLVTESVANAARHGLSRMIRAEFAIVGRTLLFTMTNDVRREATQRNISPRSLIQRVSRIGGALSVRVHDGAVTIAIEAPLPS